MRTPREKNLVSKRPPILGSVFGFINEKYKGSKKKYNTCTRARKFFGTFWCMCMALTQIKIKGQVFKQKNAPCALAHLVQKD